jgi:hypothetical protein
VVSTRIRIRTWDTIPDTLLFKRSGEKNLAPFFSSKIQTNAAKLDFKIFPPFHDGTQSERVNTEILLTRGFIGFFFYLLYSTLRLLPPLRFHWVGGC